MVWVLLFCSVVMAWIDFRAVKKFVSDDRRSWRWIAALWFVDTMPFLQMAFAFLFLRDNPTWISMASLWIVWLYVVLSLSRLPMVLALLFCNKVWGRVLGGVITSFVMVVCVYGMAVTRTDYEVKNVKIESQKLPKSFNGYKILQISDIHIGTMVNPEKELRQIIELCNSLKADAVAFTGDLVDIRYSEITTPIAKELSRLKSKDGIFSVVGNHDIGVYIKDSITLSPAMNTSRLMAEQERLGWRVLDDRTEYIRRGADSIAITGISFTQQLQEHRHSARLPELNISSAYEGRPGGVFNITLSHIPQLWDVIVDEGVADLTLSGHVHSMQLKLPAGGRGLSPSRVKYKRWSGLYEKDGHWLYINDGLGCVLYPMRIGARPELTLIELSCKYPDL